MMEAKRLLKQWTTHIVVLHILIVGGRINFGHFGEDPHHGSSSGVDAARPSGFYADNGIDQTIIYEQMGKRERREMQQEILSLLGLHHRPRPTPSGTENSAPKYMINLYRSFVDEAESIGVKSSRLTMISESEKDVVFDRHAKCNRTDGGIGQQSDVAVNDADVIMSFVNHGWRRMRKCRRIKLRTQSKPSTCKWNFLRKHRRNSVHRVVHFRHEKDKRFWFDVSEVPAEETIMEAELRLYKEVPSNVDERIDGQYRLSLFKLVQGMDPEDKELHFLDSLNISVKYNGWIKLNVTSAASDWVVFPEKNLGLYLRIQTDGHLRELQPKDVGIVGNKGRADRQPFMVAFFKTSQEWHIRRTRAAQRKQSIASDTSYGGNVYGLNSYMHFDPNSMRRSCQTRTLYVNFKDLGWQDWIIAPDGYAAFYCQGECSFPLNTNMNATNHAIVQTLVNLMKPETVPKPCCAPSKLSHISVLYYDDNSNVILKKYRNMVVRACGCH